MVKNYKNNSPQLVYLFLEKSAQDGINAEATSTATIKTHI